MKKYKCIKKVRILLIFTIFKVGDIIDDLEYQSIPPRERSCFIEIPPMVSGDGQDED